LLIGQYGQKQARQKVSAIDIEAYVRYMFFYGFSAHPTIFSDLVGATRPRNCNQKHVTLSAIPRFSDLAYKTVNLPAICRATGVQAMTKYRILLALALVAPAVYAEDASPAAPAIPAEAVTDAGAAAKADVPWLYVGSDVPVDTSWTFGELENGLRYAVKKNVVPSGQVSIRVRIDAGALHEEDDEQGFAHLLEHLAFRGSEFVPDGESKRIWQRLGVSFGSDSNAQTTPTQTTYKLDLPDSNPAKLDESMKLVAGMMRAPNISEAALNAERLIVLAELRESSGAQLEFGNAIREHIFQGQRLAKRSTIGTAETVMAATAPALRAFHTRWYRPDKTVVVIAGDADPAALEALVKTHFGDWTVEGIATPQPEFGDPQTDGKLAATIIDPTLPKTAAIAYVRPWRQVNDTIVYNEQLLIDALAQRIINRRLETLARAGGSFAYAGVEQRDEARSADVTFVSIRPVGDDWEKAITDVRAVIADAMAAPPSQADIERELALFSDFIRTQLDSYPFEAAATQAENIVRAVDIRETVAAPDTVVKVFDAMRAQFTPQRILESTRALFAAEAQRIFLSAPAPIADVETRLAKALTAPVAASKTARLAENTIGFDKLPKLGGPGKVVSSRIHERFEMESIEFANGTRALLWPNAAEAGQVRVLVRFGRGYQAVPPNTANLFWSGPMVLGDNGIGKLDRTQLDQLMNGRRLELSFGVDNDAFEWTATTRPEDLADQLTLIATKMQVPGWKAPPVERAKSVAATDYDSYEMSAMAMLQRDLQYLATSKDARWKTPTPAEVRAVTPKAFRAFWEPLLAAGPVEVMLFGDFQRDAAVAALGKSFGAMKKRAAATLPVGADSTSFPAPTAEPVRLTHKGPKDQTAAVLAWPTGGGLAAISEGRELEILAAIFRDRLFEKFRSEQAASYSPDMQNFWPDEFRSGGYLMAYSQVKPEDVDRFYAFAQEVAADLRQNPVSDDELKRATEPLKQYVERAMTGNVFWMNQLEGATYAPQRFTALGRLYRDYSEVNAAQLQELARKLTTSFTITAHPERSRGFEN
jgi:zinc protease